MYTEQVMNSPLFYLLVVFILQQLCLCIGYIIIMQI